MSVEVISSQDVEHKIETSKGMQTPFSEIDWDVLDNPAKEREEKEGEIPDGTNTLTEKDKKDDGKSSGTTVSEAEKQSLGEKTEKDKGSEVKKVEPEKPAEVKENEDIDKIVVKPGASPRVTSDIVYLKEAAKKARNEAKEIKAKLPEYEAKVKDYETKIAEFQKAPVVQPEVVQKLEARIKELEHYEFLVAPEHSSFVTKEFDAKLTTVNESVYSILKANGLPEAETKDAEGKEQLSVAYLKKTGGILGQPYEFWEKNLLPHLPPLERKRVEAKLLEAAETTDARQEALKSAPEKQQQFYKEAQEKQEKQLNEEITQAKGRIAEIQKENEWARRKEVPADATPELKKELEEHNRGVEEAERLFPVLYAPKTAVDRVNLATAVLAGFRAEKLLNDELKRSETLQKQLDEANEKLGKIKKAGDTRVRNPGAPSKISNVFTGMSLEDSFKKHLDGKED